MIIISKTLAEEVIYMISLRQLLFSRRLKQQEILDLANKGKKKPRLYQSRFSKIVNGYLRPTDREKIAISRALIDLGVDLEKVEKVRELAIAIHED